MNTQTPTTPTTPTTSPVSAPSTSAPAHTGRPLRRLRRSSRPTGAPRARTSRRLRSPARPSEKKRRPSPFQPLPEFASFKPAELETIHQYLRTHSYKESAEYLSATHNISISENRLYRYRSRLDLADQLQLAQDNTPAIENLLHFFAGRAVDLSPAGRNLILERALLLAADPNAAPSLLIQLHRLFTYEDRRAALQHRMHIADRREATRERLAEIAERRQRIVEKKYDDDKPATKDSILENQSIIRTLFGRFPEPIPFHESPSPETATSHPSHSSEPSAPTTPTTPPVSPALSAPSEPAPSLSSAPREKESLEKTVDAYTVARAREYIAHEQRCTPWPHHHLPPEYITKLRHCPCGQPTPCPIHEDKTFGPFPLDFWKLSPFSADYAASLRERNLPYRLPTEFLA